jgi:hypothetical protein
MKGTEGMIYHGDKECTELGNFKLLRNGIRVLKFPDFSPKLRVLCVSVVKSSPPRPSAPQRPSFLVAVFFLAVIFEGVLQFAGELGIQLL